MSSVPGKAPAVKLPPQVETAEDLILDGLGELLTAEEMLVRVVLPGLIREVKDTSLKDAVQQHLDETRGHVGAVKEAFLALGRMPTGKPAPVLDALRRDHEAKSGSVAAALRDGVHCRAAMATEHYEINAYETTIEIADAARAQEVSRLLRTTLEDEIRALQKLGGESRRLARLAVEEPTV